MFSSAIRRPSIVFALGCAIAAGAWFAPGIAALGLLWLLPVMWLLSDKRAQASALLFGYYAVTLVDVPAITERFMHWAAWQNWLLYMAYIALCIAIWIVCWHRCLKVRSALLGLVLLATNLPPLGAVTPANPLIAAGVVFPALGIVGLLLTYVSYVLAAFAIKQLSLIHRLHNNQIVDWQKNYWALSFVAIGCISAFLNYQVSAKTESARIGDVSIMTINTQLERYPESKTEHYQRHQQLLSIAAKQLDEPWDIVVLPEAIGGLWQPNIAWMWQDMGKQYSEQSKTLVVGFTSKTIDGSGYDNSALIFGKLGLPNGEPRQVRARVNIPVGGWQPWNPAQHQPMHLTEAALIDLQTEQQVPILFCWEEWTLWPWLVSSWQQRGAPTYAISLVNHWFNENLMLGSMQEKSAYVFSRLFGWQLHRSINEPTSN